MPPIPRNPYIAGKALGDPRGFFGRADVFRLVQTVLSSPDQNSVVLFGQRRIGKTSILLNLRSQLPAPPFVPVYFDLMDRARKSLADVSFELAATIAQELKLQQPVRAGFDDEGRGFREKFLPSVYAALGDNRLVLLFDEFDVLNVGAEEKLAPTSAAFAFFPYLRDLMTNESRLGFVFVVGRKAEELSIEFKSAFKASRFARVSVLDDESARALIRTAERDNLLHFTDDAVTRVLDLTACHPYFTQLMCQIVFERAYANEPPRVGITPADVDAIVPKVLEAGENIFEWIWDGLPPAERVIFSAIASGTDEQTVITEERLIAILQSQGIRILIRELELAPKTLDEWEMLKQTDGGYKFFVELMRRWVVARKSLDKVKDELDRIVPLADTLYQGANGFYRRSDLEHATGQLQSALNVNPNHLKARLLLGEIYRAQGKIDDAVKELERAYEIDEDSARIALETSLMQKADSHGKQGQIEEALQDYSRVLEIAPSSRIAKQLYTATVALLKKRDLKKLAELTNVLVQNGKWNEAVSAYQKLVELDSEDQRWHDGLANAQQELGVTQRYTEGIADLEQRKWLEAQRAFADVIHIHPDYKQATKFLLRANALANGLSDPIEELEKNLNYEHHRLEEAIGKEKKLNDQIRKLEEALRRTERINHPVEPHSPVVTPYAPSISRSNDYFGGGFDVGKAYTYVFEDPEWIRKVIIGGIISVIPVVNLSVLGYMLTTTKNYADGQSLPLPEWNDFGHLFMKGLYAFVGILVHFVPAIVTALCVSILGVVGGAISSASGDTAGTIGSIVNLISFCSNCVLYLYVSIVSVTLFAPLTRFAMSEYKLSSLWDFRVNFAMIKQNLRDYVIAVLSVLVVSFVAMFGIIFCVIGVIFTLFWAQLVASSLFAQFWRNCVVSGTAPAW